METKNEEDKQMAEKIMSGNVEKRKENELPSDNVQTMFLSVDAFKVSVCKTRGKYLNRIAK